MQNLTQRVIAALNNLPGFPPKPTTNPPQDGQFVLGDYLFEIHVRPEVANVAALPLTGNSLGDVRVSLADQAWYIWDGAAWQPMGSGGGVVTVTASTPIASSGGPNPNISFPSWPANAAGVLTNNGAGTLSWAAAPAATTIDVPATAQEVLLAGDLVCFFNNAGTPNVRKADATNADARLNPVGFATTGAGAGAPVVVRIAGIVDVPAARFAAAPGPADVGKRVFAWTTAGQIRLTPPSVAGDIVQRVGVLVDGSANPKVLVQVGDPTLL